MQQGQNGLTVTTTVGRVFPHSLESNIIYCMHNNGQGENGVSETVPVRGGKQTVELLLVRNSCTHKLVQ